MKKKLIIGLLICGMIIFVIGILLLVLKGNTFNKNKIEIIDATYMCNNSLEKFYEDDKYIYFFPCVKSDAVFVKFDNDNKMLVVDALEEDKVSIEELIAAGLNVYKKEKVGED